MKERTVLSRRSYGRAAYLALTGALVAACSGETAPSPGGSGDRVVVDVDASAGPPSEHEEDAGADSPFARADALYAAPPDSYAPFNVCNQCSCGAGTYCFGGGTGHEEFSGSCNHTTAAPGTLDVGCLPLPAACAAKPTCVCLIGALAPLVGCYPECTDVNGLIAYCPIP
jgi:hypothetical protein